MNDESISNEYFKYYQKYEKEYGKICVLMQIGSFYEMLMLETPDKKIGNLNDIANILNIQVTKRNKNLDHLSNNPYMAGFPKVSVNKFLPLLLDNNYTVILIDQKEEKENGKVIRFVSGIYSSSIQPIDFDNFKDYGNDLTSITIEIIENKNLKYNKNNFDKISFLCSFLNLNLTTNSFEIYEYSDFSYNSLLDKIYKILSRYKNTEIIVNIINSLKDIHDKDHFIEYMNLTCHDSLHWKIIDNKSDFYKLYSNTNYQNEYLRKIYSHINFGLLDPIDFFDLSMYQLSIFNILKTIDFIVKHDEKYIKNLEIPKIIKEYDYLTLEMNTLNQLDIITKLNQKSITKSLFDVINKTKTSIGKRGLKNLLLKPFKNPTIINKRYNLSESLENIINDLPKNIIDTSLTEICDFEKLHRKMGLQALHPYQFFSLHNTYLKIIDIFDLIIQKNKSKYLKEECLSLDTITNLKNLISEYSDLFDLNELKKYNLNELSSQIINIFNKGKIDEIDIIHSDIENIETQIENFRQNLEKIIIKTGKLQNTNDLIKLIYSDTDGYNLTCTKLRFNLLKKGMNENEFNKLTIKTNTNICKISSDEFKNFSIQLTLKKEVICKLNKLNYLETLNYLYDKYSKLNLFSDLKKFIELIDILNSNIKCKTQFNYCIPKIIDSKNSFFNAKDLRHPIIEQLNNKLEYIPNDICLNNDNNGMVLYALNSSGKSSLLRSIGIAIILAQCGLYVPCSSFEYYPFTSIITQVDMYDNLWKGQSSFVSEMVGLKKILKLADENSLVLSDELTKGTEVISATSIFTASILELLKKKSKFIFTTHLHQVATLDIIKKQKKLQICHLNVEIINGEIIFHRKLMPGPCSELYGLEVAKAVGLETDFMDIAFEIRNNLIKSKKQVVSSKTSKYNSKKLIDKCEICGYYPSNKTDIPLDIHHIDFQCTADENNFTRHFHKNSLHNLVCLCKQCHQNVHLKKINIYGYIQTTNGIKLNFENEMLLNN